MNYSFLKTFQDGNIITFLAFWPIASYTFLYKAYPYKKAYGVIAVALFQPFSINNALLLIDLLLDIFKLFLHFAILNHTGEIRMIHHKQHVLSSTASSSSINDNITYFFKRVQCLLNSLLLSPSSLGLIG